MKYIASTGKSLLTDKMRELSVSLSRQLIWRQKIVIAGLKERNFNIP